LGIFDWGFKKPGFYGFLRVVTRILAKTRFLTTRG